MKRRSFLKRSAIVSLGLVVKTSEAVGQMVPFGFWKSAAAAGALYATQLIKKVAATGSADAEMRVTQTILAVSGTANPEMQVTQAIMLASGTNAAAPAQITQVHMISAGSSGASSELQATQAILLVAAKP